MTSESEAQNTAAEAAESDSEAITPPAPTSDTPKTGERESEAVTASADDEPPTGGEEEATRVARWPSKYREAYRRLEESKAVELEQLRAQVEKAEALLDAERRRAFDAAVTAAGYSPRLLADYVAIEDMLTDEGVLDLDKLDRAVIATADELGLRPRSRRPRPVPIAGAGSSYRGGDDVMAQAFGMR